MTHGRHIKVIGKGSADRLRNIELVKTMLENLVELLDMRCLGKPHMYEVEEEIAKLNTEPFEDEGGVTGVVVLSTSHCAIHTWPLRSFFIMDIFSCRDFDASLVEPFLKSYLAVSRLRITDLSQALIPDPMWELDIEPETCTLN
jgi:S-adenosylmethionine decarboxylase